jgi:hypothetical protein
MNLGMSDLAAPPVGPGRLPALSSAILYHGTITVQLSNISCQFLAASGVLT